VRPAYPEAPAGPPAAGIAVARVTKTYGGGPTATTALAGVDLEVPAGQWVTLIGPSGCGKSTLLRIVSGLLEPDSGSVSLLGRSPHQAASGKLIAYVPQSPALLPWRTALGNVRLPFQVNRRARAANRDGRPVGPEGSENEAGEAARAVALLEDVGLGDSLHKYPSELSGGMQQRVAIARAFALEAPVLVMDEPFSALDELTREILRHQLLELWQAHQATVLFVTHSVAEAVTLSDTVVVMSPHPGRVAGVVPVALGRPRPEGIEDTPAFHEAEAAIRRLLRNRP
jgi:ABC-type nitrate/sulfonate/bicarbonate transport system ATPase subunit